MIQKKNGFNKEKKDFTFDFAWLFFGGKRVIVTSGSGHWSRSLPRFQMQSSRVVLKSAGSPRNNAVATGP